MRKKLLSVLFAFLIIVGIVFSVSNFLTERSQADEVTWETLYEYEIPYMGTIYICNGWPNDCCTVTAQPKD